MKSLVYQQNRHQKVLYRGLNICAVGFDILKFEQTSCFIVLHISIGGTLELCIGRAKPTEAPSLWWRNCLAKLQLAFNAIDLEKYLGYVIAYVKLALWRSVTISINLLEFVKLLLLKVMQLCISICAVRTLRCCFERYKLVRTTAKALWREHIALDEWSVT